MNKPLVFTAALMSAALEICKENASSLMEHEIECIIRGIKSDLDSQGF